ncbi:lanthionine synthetase C family protein [Nannocystis poenicansa]|uniref:Lanthionine synthetase C family protein n=2 Tax=Nannocystis punicea TaxID=2995304 RepID=A0ABY7HKP4_9BACT|nr:lanthionine synthetase C family protein [Nannocystis poenicansa]
MPCDLARGDVGLALFHGWMDACFPGESWDRVAHVHLTAAAQGTSALEFVPLGLHHGASGLAFCTQFLARGSRYQRMLASVESSLLPQIAAAAELCQRRRGRLHTSDFDIISGLSGMVGYLLCRTDDQPAREALIAVARALVALVGADDVGPLWRTLPDFMDETMRAHFPGGNLNCGLAHGGPGLLAALALTFRAGVRVDGSAAAIRALSEWLLASRVEDAWGDSWPMAVPLLPGVPTTPCRNAWCYGSPGVARALWLAGEALEERTYCSAALEAMRAFCRRPAPARGVDSPTLCHGLAGLLQIVMRFAHDSGSEDLHAEVQRLFDQLVACHAPGSLLGFQNVETGDVRTDHPGLLEGAAGVASVLLAAACAIEPTWDRAFLLS